MQMHALALGAKCGGRGESGLSRAGSWARRPSSLRSDATASVPRPLAAVARKLRRDWRMWVSIGCIDRFLGLLSSCTSLRQLYPSVELLSATSFASPARRLTETESQAPMGAFL